MNKHSRLFAGVLVWVAFAMQVAAARAQNYPCNIFVMRPDGTGVRQVVQVDGYQGLHNPRWSHDGKRIVFEGRGEQFSQFATFLVNADGSGLEKLGGHMRPDLSPDDKQVVYDDYSSGTGTSEIFVQNLDGSGRTKIAAGHSGRWSPDGSQIAYTDGTNAFIEDLLSGESRALFDKDNEQVFGGFNWSPDGALLAVTSRPTAGAARELRLFNTKKPDEPSRLRLTGGMGGPTSFSPDGKRIVFADGSLLRIAEVAGTKPPTMIPGQTGKNREPHWSPDGQWIVYSGEVKE